MAKSNRKQFKSGNYSACEKVTGSQNVTNAGVLGKRGPRRISKGLRQRNPKNIIRNPHGLIDPEEYYEIRGIIKESGSKYMIDWADSPEGRSFKPTRELKCNVTEAAVRDWKVRKSILSRVLTVRILRGYRNHQSRLTPHGQTALAGIRHLVSLHHPDQMSFDQSGSRLPTPAVARPTSFPARANLPIQVSQPQPMELAFNAARRHGYPRCKARVPVGSIKSRDHPIKGTFAFLDPVDTSLPGECARLVMTGRALAARTPTLPSYYAATASQV
jgi:hypothetical protein